MYTNITEKCKNVIGRSSRTFAASFVIGEKKYSDIKSLKVMVPSVANGKITIGGTVSKNVEIIVDKVDVLPGVKICVYEGVKLDTGEYEDVPMGTYKVRSAVTKAHMTTIVAEGPLSTETELGYFSELIYPVTTIQMLEEISEAIGVPIVTDNLEELYVESKPEGYTYREVIGFIAGMHGTNAVELRDGSIAFKWYEYCEDDVFTDKADAPELSNDTFVIEKFECETGNATITRGAGKIGIVISNPLMTEAAAGALWEKIAGFSYKPATFNIKSGTPLVDEWNYFSYEGESVIATELQFIHDGGLQNTFKSVGESEKASASGYKGPIVKALKRFQAELVLVNEALVNKLSAEEADVRYLQADKLEVITAEVESAVIKNLEGDFATFEALNATNARIEQLDVLKLNASDLSAEVAKFGYATVEQLYATDAKITVLEANQLTVSSLKSDFADIALSNVAVENVGKLFADVGLITSATIKDGHVTGYLDSVEVNANSVTAGILSVDRLIFRGAENSIVYELNNITGALQAVQSDTLNGEILTDRSITVDKIVAKSITANEIAASTITTNELNVSNIFSNSAVISTITAQSAFINAISTNSVVVGASNNASSALSTANSAKTTATTANANANTALSTANSIAANVYVPGTTTINGGNIATGTITADKINVTDLSALNATIGGWFVNDSSLYSDTITLNPSIITVRGEYGHTRIVSGYIRIDNTNDERSIEIQSGLTVLHGYANEIRFTDDNDVIRLSAFYDRISYKDKTSINFSDYSIIMNGGTQGVKINSPLSVTGVTTLSSTLTVSGDINASSRIVASGSIYTSGEFASYNPNAFRSMYGDYGTFWRNDGQTLYLMFTASGDPYGLWNDLRPLYFNLASGTAYFGHSVNVSGDTVFNATVYHNWHMVLNNYKVLYGQKSDGSLIDMLSVNTDNSCCVCWGPTPLLHIGHPSQVSRVQMFSSTRIDFLAGGATSTGQNAVTIEMSSGGQCILRPTNNAGTDAGTASYRLGDVYVYHSPNVYSDRRNKNDIQDLDERYFAIAKILVAKSYLLNGDKTGRRHSGYIAQDVEAAMKTVGLTYEECSFFNRNWVEREDYIGYELSLTYEELHTVQIASLQQQVNDLQNKITQLQSLQLGA